MGATVVNTSIDASNWSRQKPSDFTDKELDQAIKAYQTLGKIPTVAAPPTLTPSMCGVTEFKDAINKFEATIKDLKEVIKHQEKAAKALKTVGSAAKSTAGKLSEAAKSKSGGDKNKYQSAASVATGIGESASAMIDLLK